MKESAGRILMLLEHPFPRDVRVRNEARVLRDAGYKVTVVALKCDTGERFWEEVDGIHVYRIPELTLFKKTPKRNPSVFHRLLTKITSSIGYVSEYLYFTLASLFVSSYVLMRHGFDVVHAHNPPDTLFLVGLCHKVFGKKFIFDHHDLSPELYRSRFGAKPDLIYRLLLAIEQCSVWLADVVIATNETYKDIEIKRDGIKPDKVFVVRNGPDLNKTVLLPPDEQLRSMGKSILAYVGVLNPQDGVDYLLRALKYLACELHRTDFYCVIMGRGDSLEDLRALAKELELQEYVKITGFVPDEVKLRILSAADICVDPDPSSPLNDVSTWIKIMEYMALGKPIVSFDLKETRVSAQEAAIYVTPNDEKEFAKAIAHLIDNPAERARMGEFGRRRVENELAWHHVSRNLLSAYDRLLARPYSEERARSGQLRARERTASSNE
jgi:glycosyltransferase involved in cell wall biosynthesis